MKLLDFAISKTAGRLSDKYKTVAQWLDVYQSIVDVMEIANKTKKNMQPTILDIRKVMGNRIISSISPMDISNLILSYSNSPNTAKRRLNETKRIFHNAMCYGWINFNPATAIQPPKVKIIRKRLKLEDWRKIVDYSKDNMQPWVSRAFLLALITGQRRGDIINLKFSDVKNGMLFVQQGKSGAKIALPLGLKLDCIDTTLGEVIADCVDYAKTGTHLVRKNKGGSICPAYLSAVFESAREHATNLPIDRTAPSFHEIRSLAERLYRVQGIDTQVLLGHKHRYITDIYNDPRNDGEESFRILKI